MNATDIEKCLSSSQKRAIQKSIKDYIYNEIYSETRDEAIKIAKQWVKENQELIRETVDIEMKKRIPQVVKSIRVGEY